MSDFGSIIKFFDKIGTVLGSLISAVPAFLRPLLAVVIAVSVIYLVVGRD